MSVNLFLVIISSLFVTEILSEEKFCAKDRKLLLGGVFNYDKILFGYSWKEVNSVQLWLVWRYEIKNNHLISIGEDVAVDQIFPSIPLFRAGMGLTMKCESTDTTCKSYRQLVFIFFQTSYKTFRFANDTFGAENDKTKIPWGLKPRGEANDWFFGYTNMDNINAIMFMGGYQSQIFVVSKDTLLVSAVDIKAKALKWTQVAESKEFGNALGGFIIGSNLYINKNEAPDNVLIKYDQNGKESEQITVWKYFGCDGSEGGTNPDAAAAPGKDKEKDSENIETRNDRNNSLATIIMVCIVIVLVLTNIISGLFWLTVYKKKTNATEV